MLTKGKAPQAWVPSVRLKILGRSTLIDREVLEIVAGLAAILAFGLILVLLQQ